MRRRIIIAIIGGLLIGFAGLGIGVMFEYDVFFAIIMSPLALFVAAMGIAWVYNAAFEDV